MTNLTSTQPAMRRRSSAVPGWPEMLTGAAAYAGSFALVAVFLPLIEDDRTAGVVGFVVSGLMGMIALSVAALTRIRGLSAFGIRRASARHYVVGAAFGLVAFVVGNIAATAIMMTSGDVQNVQTSYQAGAAGGVFSLVLTLIAGSIITPVGEEAFFRGVIANALFARFGAWVGIVVSAAIFAVAHGINPVMVVAFIVGILAALLFRWSGSIWPGVVLHSVNNSAALLLPLVVVAATA